MRLAVTSQSHLKKCKFLYYYLPYYNKNIERLDVIKHMDDIEKKVECPIEFNESLINKNFIYFNVEGEPFAKQRPRATRKGRYITVYTPRETKLYESKVVAAYQRIFGSKQLEGDLTVDIEGVFSVPKSISNKKAQQMLSGKIPHTKKPDCDNMAKVCLDALNGIAYPDDALINRLNVSKRYGDNAMVRITITENKEKTKGDISENERNSND